ncbi:MAG: LamG-like jellyroll fold domain-containing protein, partial [bacterium]
MKKNIRTGCLTAVVFVLTLLVTGICAAEDGLVAYWNMNEGTGTVINDTSGNNNNGTIYGATWVDGYSDKGLQFDGVNDYVYCGNGAGLNGMTALTIDLWIKPQALPGKNTRIVSKGDLSTGMPAGYQYVIYYDTAGNVHFLISNGSSMVNIAAPLAIGYFQRVTAVWDGQAVKLFINDIVKANGNLSGTLNSASAGKGLYIGAFSSGDCFFNGTIDNIRIYNKSVKPSYAVRIGQVDRNLVVDGLTLHPCIMNWSSPMRETANPWQLADIRGKGFNVIRIPVLDASPDVEAEIELLGNSQSKYRQFLDKCAAASLKIILGFQAGTAIPGGENATYAVYKAAVIREIELLKDHPAIIAWNFLDEPINWWEQSGGDKLETDLQDFYNAVKAMDPYRPAFINHTYWSSTGEPYGTLEASDFGSFDLYPIGHYSYPAYGTFISLSRSVEAMNSDCRYIGKPAHWYTQLSILGYREPTSAEEKCLDYTGFIYGTRLFNHYRYKPMSTALWDGMGPLMDELKKLSGMVAGDNCQELGSGSLNDTVH